MTRRVIEAVAMLSAFALLSAAPACADPAGEQTFVSHVAPAFPNIPPQTLVDQARAVCTMLSAHTPTNTVVSFLSHRLGTSMESAGQFMDAAMVADCPNLRVGPDGIAR